MSRSVEHLIDDQLRGTARLYGWIAVGVCAGVSAVIMAIVLTV